MRWIKASKNKWPESQSEVLFKYKGFRHFGYYEGVDHSEFFSTNNGLCVHRSEIDEWLDETEQPSHIPRSHVKQVIEKWVDSPPWTKEVQEKIISEICEPSHISGQGDAVQMSNEDLYNLALDRFCSPHGNANPETYAFIQGYNLAAARALLSAPSPSREAELEKCLEELITWYEHSFAESNLTMKGIVTKAKSLLNTDKP